MVGWLNAVGNRGVGRRQREREKMMGGEECIKITINQWWWPGRMRRAMEGRVREIKGEVEEGGGGDEHDEAHHINGTGGAWLGNPFRILRNSAINPIPNLLNSRIFIRILFFRS
jgi:hypothetical protein